MKKNWPAKSIHKSECFCLSETKTRPQKKKKKQIMHSGTSLVWLSQDKHISVVTHNVIQFSGKY